MRPESKDTEPIGAHATDDNGAPTTLVLFTRGEDGKGRAAKFDDADAELAIKAAALMGLKFLRLTAVQQQALAGKLPFGKIFSVSQKALVPFCNRQLLAQLEAMGGEVPPPPDPAVTQAALDGEPAADAPVGGTPADATQQKVVPSTWAEIMVGSVVLATEGHMEGWFEAVVTAAKPNDLFELRWRDWPEEQAIVRKRGHLGLLPPAEATKVAK